jgi:hypothetical protein|tara:strand:+ start:519 stop:800 length:282 start_codon:yes stop_codon:yes gene_type:complete
VEAVEYKQIEGGDAILASLTLLYDPKTKKIIVQRLSQDAEELRRILDEWHPSFRDTPDIVETTRWVNELMNDSYSRIIEQYGDEILEYEELIE